MRSLPLAPQLIPLAKEVAKISALCTLANGLNSNSDDFSVSTDPFTSDDQLSWLYMFVGGRLQAPTIAKGIQI